MSKRGGSGYWARPVTEWSRKDGYHTVIQLEEYKTNMCLNLELSPETLAVISQGDAQAVQTFKNLSEASKAEVIKRYPSLFHNGKMKPRGKWVL